MSLESVHNFYERLVFQEIQDNYAEALDEDAMADMACLALNRIPPRYIRYDIDMSFYLSPSEHIEIESQVRTACRRAYRKMLNLNKHEVVYPEHEGEHNHGHDA